MLARSSNSRDVRERRSGINAGEVMFWCEIPSPGPPVIVPVGCGAEGRARRGRDVRKGWDVGDVGDVGGRRSGRGEGDTCTS